METKVVEIIFDEEKMEESRKADNLFFKKVKEGNLDVLTEQTKEKKVENKYVLNNEEMEKIREIVKNVNSLAKIFDNTKKEEIPIFDVSNLTFGDANTFKSPDEKEKQEIEQMAKNFKKQPKKYAPTKEEREAVERLAQKYNEIKEKFSDVNHRKAFRDEILKNINDVQENEITTKNLFTFIDKKEDNIDFEVKHKEKPVQTTKQTKELVKTEAITLDKCDSCKFDHTITTKTYKSPSLIKDEFVVIREEEEKGMSFPSYSIQGHLDINKQCSVNYQETAFFNVIQCPNCNAVKIKGNKLGFEQKQQFGEHSRQYPPVISKPEYWTDVLHSLSDLVACNPVGDDVSIISRMILAIESGANVNAAGGVVVKNAITIGNEKLIDALVKYGAKINLEWFRTNKPEDFAKAEEVAKKIEEFNKSKAV